MRQKAINVCIKLINAINGSIVGKITLQLNSFGWLDCNLIMAFISACALGFLKGKV